MRTKHLYTFALSLLIIFSSLTIHPSELSTNLTTTTTTDLDLSSSATKNSPIAIYIDGVVKLSFLFGGAAVTKVTYDELLWPRLVLYGRRYLQPYQFYGRYGYGKDKLLTTTEWLLEKGFNPNSLVEASEKVYYFML